jgi:hypothetical protein
MAWSGLSGERLACPRVQRLTGVAAGPSITRCRFGRRSVAAGCSRERLPER